MVFEFSWELSTSRLSSHLFDRPSDSAASSSAPSTSEEMTRTGSSTRTLPRRSTRTKSGSNGASHSILATRERTSKGWRSITRFKMCSHRSPSWSRLASKLPSSEVKLKIRTRTSFLPWTKRWGSASQKLRPTFATPITVTWLTSSRRTSSLTGSMTVPSLTVRRFSSAVMLWFTEFIALDQILWSFTTPTSVGTRFRTSPSFTLTCFAAGCRFRAS